MSEILITDEVTKTPQRFLSILHYLENNLDSKIPDADRFTSANSMLNAACLFDGGNRIIGYSTNKLIN